MPVILLAFLGLAVLLPAQQQRREGFRIGVKVDLVSLDVTVLDAEGRPVEGLTAENFEVLEDGNPQEISVFQEADLPITLGLVIDTSGSMRNKLHWVNQSIHSFLNNSNRDNELFIIDFSHDEAELLQDFTRDPDDVRDAIKEKMLAGGGTPLWDSIYLGLGHAEKGGLDRKALLIISDGEDKDSYYSFENVLERIKTNEIQVYFIGLQEKRDGSLFDLGSFSRERAAAEIQQIADISGGICFFPDDLDQLSEITIAIANELRHQYRIGYNPQRKPDISGFREITVRLKQLPERAADYTIRTRRGYQVTVESDSGG
jgi:Ca-activated chloride channel family protein